MSWRGRTAIVLLTVVTSVVIYFTGAWFGLYGEEQHYGNIVATSNPEQTVNTERQLKGTVSDAPEKGLETSPLNKQILFGDLHVHTTLSMDAFQNSLPIMQGMGVNPPSDACNFARFCSAIDFFSLNDHAESLTPDRWQKTKESVRQCNAISEDPANPDLVAFLGWEWTQIGSTPDEHYGHKNVVLKDTEEDKVPTRPIAAAGQAFDAMRSANAGALKILGPMLDPANRQEYYNIDKFVRDTKLPELCPKGVDVRDLPSDCIERADTPAELFEKLRQWDMPSVVIPHGTAWGNTAPAGVYWNTQLSQGNHDPDLQTAIEVYSGHGNSEEYRPWRAVDVDENGRLFCPEPTEDFTPGCWQAGEIIRKRCLAEGESEQECDSRAITARGNHVLAGKNGSKTVPGGTADEWQDAGQCTDCFLPTYNHRPGMSAQAALAIRNFNEGEGEEDRFRFGFIGSSDNHSAMAGSGYKEVDRISFTDTHGPSSTWLHNKMRGKVEPLSFSIPLDGTKHIRGSNKERSNSFMFTGGLVGLHAMGRDRESIWASIKRNEVYSTSGPRIMLWFELLNGPEQDNNRGVYGMGQSLVMQETPRFRAKAFGAFKQKPGCPEQTADILGTNELQRLCRGECYNPSDERTPIVRMEVVKITPQVSPDEPLDSVILDTWKTFDCPADGHGCTIEFEDPDFNQGARDALYYVRAIQQATPTINGGTLRCEYDDSGQCRRVNACYSDDRTGADDDCLADSEHRAWSSPIFVDFAGTPLHAAGLLTNMQ